VNLSDRFAHVEETLLSQFREAGFIQHQGDKGENREEILREFLSRHLPKRYGVAKGEIITRDGTHSHSADIIIYDAANAPLLYSGKTAVIPIEGVYGIIEVKSTLSKSELLDTTQKIEKFKRLSPRELSVIQTREYVTVHRPSRPFGIVVGYQLGDNSLTSLRSNWDEENKRIHDVNHFANVIAILGVGLLHFEVINLSAGTKELLLDTDQFVTLLLTAQKRAERNEQSDEILLRVVESATADRTFGRLFIFLLIMLARLRLSVPDLGRYYDPELPMMIIRES
jgi:hypothetical protein